MLKESINGVLGRATGYQLRRVSTGESDAAQLATARRELARVTGTLEKTRARLARTMPTHYDDAATAILRRVEPRTMTDYGKLFGLVEATRYVARHGIAGDIVECGVWRGGSMQAVALALMEQGVTDRQLHLFDTFEGMPPPTAEDRRGATTAEELLATHDKEHRVWAIAGLDDVQAGMSETGYPQGQIHYHQGLVEDTVPSRAPREIALLRLDTDWYASTRHELEHLYDRLTPGGVLIIDDYGDWDGARKATDEFLTTRHEPLLLLPVGSGRLALKPRA